MHISPSLTVIDITLIYNIKVRGREKLPSSVAIDLCTNYDISPLRDS